MQAPTILHLIPEKGSHLYIGRRSYTATRLYAHLPWTIRDDQGWPLEHFRSLRECERFITEREAPSDSDD